MLSLHTLLPYCLGGLDFGTQNQECVFYREPMEIVTFHQQPCRKNATFNTLDIKLINLLYWRDASLNTLDYTVLEGCIFIVLNSKLIRSTRLLLSKLSL